MGPALPRFRLRVRRRGLLPHPDPGRQRGDGGAGSGGTVLPSVPRLAGSRAGVRARTTRRAGLRGSLGHREVCRLSGLLRRADRPTASDEPDPADPASGPL